MYPQGSRIRNSEKNYDQQIIHQVYCMLHNNLLVCETNEGSSSTDTAGSEVRAIVTK